MTDGLFELIVGAIWFILPAYVANAAPVILGGGTPLDWGRKFTDRRRIFGPGKTIRGFAAGLIAGTILGVLQGTATGQFSTYFIHGFLLALGALTGDLLGSFVKRRLNIARGDTAPVLDQLGFVVFALLLTSPLVAPGWDVILAILIITLPIHLATNFVGYRLGLKSRPY